MTDMMTRIANLTSETMAEIWPEAEGLPAAAELRGLLAVPGIMPFPASGWQRRCGRRRRK